MSVFKHQQKIRYELSLKQNHACAICGRIMKDKLFIDHCHKTGKIRGLLCPTCNAGLGFFRDDPNLLKNAVMYLSNKSVFVNP